MEFKDLATILIAVFAVIVSLIALGHQWLNSIQTWKIAEEANNKADKANEISQKALIIAREDHEAKYFPIIEATIDAIVEDIDNEELDNFEIRLTNTVNTDVTITKIDIDTNAVFITEEIKNIKAPFNLPILIRFNFSKDQLVRGILVDKIKGTSDSKSHEQRLGDQVEYHTLNYPIFVWFNFNEKKCLAYLKFSGTSKKYEGKSMKIE